MSTSLEQRKRVEEMRKTHIMNRPVCPACHTFLGEYECEEKVGTRKGKRFFCAGCGHVWFQPDQV